MSDASGTKPRNRETRVSVVMCGFTGLRILESMAAVLGNRQEIQRCPGTHMFLIALVARGLASWDGGDGRKENVRGNSKR